MDAQDRTDAPGVATVVSLAGRTWRTRAGCLPVDPFVEWLSRRVAEYDTLWEAAEAVNIDGSRLKRLLERSQAGLTLDLIDRTLTAAAVPLWEVYPELGEVVGGIHDRFCGPCAEIVTVGDSMVCPWCETPTEEVAQ